MKLTKKQINKEIFSGETLRAVNKNIVLVEIYGTSSPYMVATFDSNRNRYFSAMHFDSIIDASLKFLMLTQNT